jgi:hypothetical protein
MINRTILMIFSFALLVVISVPDVRANGKRIPINLKFAGTLIANVEHFIPPAGPTVTSALIHVSAWGFPGGRVLIRGFGGQSGAPNGPCSLGDVTAGTEIPITENPLVMTFPDLSLLFANGDGRICVDFVTGKQEFEIHIEFTGGRGKFKDASGGAVIRGEAEPVDSRRNFNGETGSLKGVINLP